MPDAALVERIRGVLAASPFHGEGHRKVWARLRVAGVRTSKQRVLRLIAYSDEAGRGFRFEAGRHSEAKPATGPISSRPVTRHSRGSWVKITRLV
jgi:hypothetical protein